MCKPSVTNDACQSTPADSVSTKDYSHALCHVFAAEWYCLKACLCYRFNFSSDRNLSTSREVWLPEAAPHVLVVYVPAILSRYMYNALLD